jgi:hypothetical protein
MMGGEGLVRPLADLKRRQVANPQQNAGLMPHSPLERGKVEIGIGRSTSI